MKKKVSERRAAVTCPAVRGGAAWRAVLRCVVRLCVHVQVPNDSQDFGIELALEEVLLGSGARRLLVRTEVEREELVVVALLHRRRDRPARVDLLPVRVRSERVHLHLLHVL